MSERRNPYRPLFEPALIAVVGASATGVSLGNEFIRHSLSLGFAGRIVPIHPSAATIEGLPAVKSFSEIGADVDFAYISVKAEDTPALISSAKGIVRFAQVVSSGFGEAANGQALQAMLVAEAQEAGVRLLGPNSLGVYSPRGRVSFIGGATGEVGSVGIIAQSGGLGADIILRGQNRGLRYSAVVTLGNSADVGPVEMTEYFLADPCTRVIGLYTEDIKDGRAFFRLLKVANGAKPVVMLLGGQSKQGRKAATSHTGSLVSGQEIWKGVARQTGTVIVRTLDEFLDVLLAFQALDPHRGHPTKRCILFGNGGGTSVLAADAFDRRGLEIMPLEQAAIDKLEALALFPGTSIANPVDTPITTLRQRDGEVAYDILAILLAYGAADAVVMHLNLSMFSGSANHGVDLLRNLLAAIRRVRRDSTRHVHFALVLRSDGSAIVESRRREFRDELVPLRIPVYDEIVNAADALAGIAHFERCAEPASVHARSASDVAIPVPGLGKKYGSLTETS